MGWCEDPSTTYLKRLSYNVVRHPREGIAPLDLVGRQGKTTAWLGRLDKLITYPPGETPKVDRDLVATDINGQQSSTMKLGIGLSVLGPIIGAMGGGNLGVETNYTNAKAVKFLFQDVLADRAAPVDVGVYLKNAEVDAENPLLLEYVLGNGELFVITDTAKALSITVKYERSEGVDARVDVPTIQNAVGADVSVSAAQGSSGTITYVGPKYLVFGFRCFRVGVLDGEIRLTTSQQGAVVLAATGPSADAVVAREAAVLTGEGEGLLDLAPAEDAIV